MLGLYTMLYNWMQCKMLQKYFHVYTTNSFFYLENILLFNSQTFAWKKCKQKEFLNDLYQCNDC